MGTPMAEENLAAASKREVAKLRSCDGNQRPIAFAFAGKVGDFADSEQEACSEESGDAGGDGRGEGGDAPEKDADTADAADTEFIEDDTDGKLAERVGRDCRRWIDIRR